MKIYLSDTDTLDSARFDALLQSLPACRKEKVLCLQRDDARKRSLAAGLLLARALSPFGLSEADALSGPYGKPYFPAGTGPCFNLSHSGSRVMCAVGDREVGCDVEQIRERRDTDGIAQRYFAPEELAALETADETERKKLFYRYWTLKESFLKAVGSGLLQSLDRFCIHMTDDRISVRPAVRPAPARSDLQPPAWDGYDLSRFRFRELSFMDGYCYAVCQTGGRLQRQLRPEWIDLSEF